MSKVLVSFALSVMVAAAVLAQADKPSEKEKAEIQKIIDKIPAVSLDSYRAKIRFAPLDGSKPVLKKGFNIDSEKPMLVIVTPREIYAEMPWEILGDDPEPERRVDILHFSGGVETAYWPDVRWASVWTKTRAEFLSEYVCVQSFNPLWRSIHFSDRTIKDELKAFAREGKVRYRGTADSWPSLSYESQAKEARESVTLWFDPEFGYSRKIQRRIIRGQGQDVVAQGVDVLEYNAKGKSVFPGKVRMTNRVGTKDEFVIECSVEEFELLASDYKVDFKLPAGTLVADQDKSTTYRIP